jgi:hypothetical protein
VIKLGQAAGKKSIKFFESFDALKYALGPAGQGKVWHHIVEKRAPNVEKFGKQAVHNTVNVVPVSAQVNHEINVYYSRIRPFSNDQPVRQWLGSQSYEEQYKFGKRILELVQKGSALP